ncbi:hypothetical protein BDB01DRAFT_802529 [Pilobolus umbonatus]|nr:hypothetical protein BDB01DRAFT_802529 [Pilobolus umbonatus]
MKLLDSIELDLDVPSSLPNLGIIKTLLHFTQIILSFIALCTSASIISTQRYYYGNSHAAPSYTLVISIISLFLSTILTFVPWSRFNQGQCVPIRKLFIKSRINLIMSLFLVITWFIAMVAMTTYANNRSTCEVNYTMRRLYSSYNGDWNRQCDSSKATAAFCWFSFFICSGATFCCVILFWHEKQLNHSRYKRNKGGEDPIMDEVSTDNSNKVETQHTTIDSPCVPIPMTEYAHTPEEPTPYSHSPYHSPQYNNHSYSQLPTTYNYSPSPHFTPQPPSFQHHY